MVRVLLRLEHSAPGHPRDDGGSFELNAEVDPLDDGNVVTSVGFRGRHDKMDAVAEAIAAVIGPVVTVEDSSGLPRLHGNR